LVLFGLFIATDTVNLIANWMSVVLPWFNSIGYDNYWLLAEQ
jgi:hypothetical protein